ncbi:tRNA adenosine(34) deaminase TadA [Alicyclobacillus kakegawensis]|uniref:tRNA adenosine(34) deaminase TadA n=1 Tax=Alicyclobacillus kakegawensis TaxID=392012 RepID=UPI001FE15DC6|nr:tRNA adenosine(34) deaminase TadA [Alicyclobacillus kakegawensis]
MLNRSLDEHYMSLALEAARRAAERGEVPIGAVIVQGGEVVATAHNWRETWADPTAHAELLALRAASRRLGTWRLAECDLYVTLEPCPMCAGAVMLARVRRLVYGAADAKGGAVQSKLSVLQPGLWNHQPEISAGILAEECGMILKDFFQGLRRNNRPATEADESCG